MAGDAIPARRCRFYPRSSGVPMPYLNIVDYRRAAKRRLPRGVFEYVDRGTEDEVALTGLRSALDNIRLAPCVLTGVPAPDLSRTVLGRPLACPIIIEPTAAAGLLWYDGEVALARAAARTGIPFCASTQSITAIEDIAARGGGGDLWFQLYVWEDRALSDRLVDRVASLGVSALVLTVDTPVAPKREYNIRNGFDVPIRPTFTGGIDVVTHPRWAWQVLGRYLRAGGMPAYANYPDAYQQPVTQRIVAEQVRLAARLSWDDVAALRDRWRGKLIIKGILHPADARKAVAIGCDGIVVSSHGGRNLDAAPSPAEVLPTIASEVAGRTAILADSGVGRGSDIIKYLALGADAVLVGRSVLYGVAVAGEAGAQACLDILRDEMSRCLTFLGQGAIADMRHDLIWNGGRTDGPAATASSHT